MMNLRQLLPRGKPPEEVIKSLEPVFEGEVLFKEGRYEDAEKKYRQALENFPARSGGRFLIYNKLGIVYEQLSDRKKALEAYERCAAEGSVTPFTYQRLSSLLFESGNLARASDYCQKGIRCLKRAKTTVFQEIYFWLGFKRTMARIRRRLS